MGAEPCCFWGGLNPPRGVVAVLRTGSGCKTHRQGKIDVLWKDVLWQSEPDPEHKAGVY